MRTDSVILKRSIIVHGRKTSVSLEDRFWVSLKLIADDKSWTLQMLVNAIDDWRRTKANRNPNLSSACRLYVLDYLSPEMAQAA
jgi:predicted DNA-binding ribbon-helix-helix protein